MKKYYTDDNHSENIYSKTVERVMQAIGDK